MNHSIFSLYLILLLPWALICSCWVLFLVSPNASTHFFFTLYPTTVFEESCVDTAWYLASHVPPPAGLGALALWVPPPSLGAPFDWGTAALPLRFS